jgi:hypothetical protein
MPFADKLRFNTELATLLRKEGKSGAVGKAAKKEKKSKDPSIKRTAAPGTQAWIAFVKHCKDTMSERFTECTLEKERLAVAAAIKAEDKDVYDAFVVKFKSDHPVVLQGDHSASPSEDEAEDVSPPAPAPTPTPVPTLSAKEKLEKLKAVTATVALKNAEPKAKAEKPVAAPKAKADKPVATPKAKAEPKAKKEVKKAAPKAKAAEKTVEEAAMPKKQIDGTDYWFDPDTNGLYNIVDGGFGAWVGYFQPDNNETPIRRTESPADE